MAFCLIVLALCLMSPNFGRIFLGVFYVVMAIGINVVLALSAPDQFVALGTAAPLLWPYAWFFSEIIARSPVLFGFLAAAYEIAIGLLLLSKGPAVHWGIFGGIAHLIVITPLGVWTLPNPLLAVSLAVLLRREYQRTFAEQLRTLVQRAV